MERVSPRGRRALVVLALVLVALVAAGVVYLRPAHAPAQASRATVPATAQRWQLGYVSFGDANRGAATMTNRGQTVTFLTSDGGRTWHLFSTEPGVTIFLDRSHAVALDLGLKRSFKFSDDTGRTWHAGLQPVTLRPPFGLGLGGRILGGPFFLDLAVGWWLDPTPGTPLTLWRTSDGGRSWHNLKPSGIPTAGPRPLQLAFVDQLRGALALPPGGPGQWPSLLITEDGGQTWRPVAPTWPAANVAPTDVGLATPLAHGDRLVLSLDIVLVSGTQGLTQLIKRFVSVSEDGGLTWAPWTATPGTSIGSVLAFDDAGRLVQAGEGRLWTSADLGHTWRSQALPKAAGNLVRMISARGGALFVATLPGPAGPGPYSPQAPTLLRSLDGGVRWTDIPLPTPPTASQHWASSL